MIVGEAMKYIRSIVASGGCCVFSVKKRSTASCNYGRSNLYDEEWIDSIFTCKQDPVRA